VGDGSWWDFGDVDGFVTSSCSGRYGADTVMQLELWCERGNWEFSDCWYILPVLTSLRAGRAVVILWATGRNILAIDAIVGKTIGM